MRFKSRDKKSFNVVTEPIIFHRKDYGWSELLRKHAELYGELRTGELYGVLINSVNLINLINLQ